MWDRSKSYVFPVLLVIVAFAGTMAGAAYVLRDREVPPAPVPIVPEPDKTRPIILPERVEIEVGDWADIRAKSLGPVEWNVPKSLVGNCKIRDNELTFLARKEGTYEISASTVVDCKPSKAAWVTVQVGKVTPGPKPPNPPDPPDPKPDPAPIPEAGFRVLFIYETADLGTYPKEQQAALTSQEIRQYLNAKCVLGPDGKTPERRFYDKDVDLSGESKLWQKAMQRPRGPMPWLIVSNGSTGYEGPVPANIAETLKLLKKYGD